MKKIIKNLGFVIMMLSISLVFSCNVNAAESDYEYTVENGKATITNYKGGESNITIPDTLGGYQVTAIGEGAFKSNKAIQSVVFSNNIEIIDSIAFYQCNNLKTIKLPDNIKVIGNYAFDVTSLSDVIIPDGCIGIGIEAFAVDNSIKITLPDSIERLGWNEHTGTNDNEKIILNTGGNSAAYLVVSPGSVGHNYAIDKGIYYYYRSEYSPSTIAFAKPNLTINVGEEYIFGKDDFIIMPSTTYITEPARFTTSDYNIAYVSDEGVLKARREGTVTINATISDEHLENDVTTTIPLTVNVVESRKKVDSINITLDGVSVHDKFINKTKGDYSYIDIKNIIVMYKGESIKLDASIKPINAIYTGEWTTVDNIISINENGLLTALETGTAQVIYSTSSSFGNVNESNSNYVMIWVDEKPNNENPTNPSEPTTPTDPTTPTTPTNPATPTNPTNPETPTTQVGKITLTASKIDLQKGKTIKTLELKTNQLEGDKIVNVTSSNKKVLKATIKGQTISLKGLKTNSKYVTVTVTMQSGAKATCKVRVVGSEVKTKKLSISDKKLSLLKGESKKLTITRNPISATDKITWTSSNTKVATVDKSGKVKTKSDGKATITATSASGKKVTCKVTVSNVLNADTINIQKGKTIKTLAVTAKQLKGDTIASVKSSNSKVLQVSLDGQTIVLKGLKTSSKYVTVTVNMASGAKGTCKVKVVKSSVKTQKITANDSKKTLTVGATYQMDVTRNPISATDKLTYKSSNKKVATVDKEGNIVPLKRGKATITVSTANGIKATCKITVK